MELGESPFAGAEREVEEETGLKMEATGIFCIEYKPSKKKRGSSGYHNWIRYGVTGTIVGGSLKTEVLPFTPFILLPPPSSSLLFAKRLKRTPRVFKPNGCLWRRCDSES